MADDDERRPRVRDSGFDEAFDRCANCGDPLPHEEWCPTATRTDEDGRLVVRSFCDDDCRDEWTDDSDTA